MKGKQYCKRKIANVDYEECVPNKVQILDMQDVDEELVSEICTTESNLENENSEKIVQSVTSEYSDNISETTHRFYISERQCEQSQCLSGNNDSNNSINSTDTENVKC